MDDKYYGSNPEENTTPTHDATPPVENDLPSVNSEDQQSFSQTYQEAEHDAESEKGTGIEIGPDSANNVFQESFDSRQSLPHYPERPSINMQLKPRRMPTWLVVVLSVVAALYFVVSTVLIIMLLNPSSSGSAIQQATGMFQETEDTSIEEHIHISDSQKSAGAKTTDGALTVKQISEKVRPSVVGVTGENSSAFASASVGSGIIMSSNGYIITNNHVIEGMTRIQVVLDDGTTYDAHLIGADSRSDLAVIKIDATDLPAAEFGDSEKLEQGDPAIAIGNPAGLQLQNTVTYGIISAINRDIIVEDRAMTLIQTDASINPGNSGGPLVNEFGQVIGINTIKVGISYYEGLGFAIPMNTAKPIIDELISRGYIKGRPSIGITGTTLSERDSAYYGLPSGLYIEYVHPYSDAFKKGLRRGDIITHMNGTKLSSTAEIKQIRDNFTAGDTVTLTIYRNSKEVDIDVILMDEATLSNTEGFKS